MKGNVSPDIDASIGLIYRLNNLWTKVDYYAENGKYEKWDWILDRIYCNLQYRNPMDKVINKENGKVSYKLPTEDTAIFNFYRRKISKVRKDFEEAKSNRVRKEKRTNHYYILLEKDMWLRKFMKMLGLYVKETEKRPGTSTFGNLGGRK